MTITMTGTSEGLGTRKPEILVVEDNFLTASEICDAVRDCGFSVAGAVGRLNRGLEFLAERHIDGAIVDINLDDTQSYPLCVELERRRVPYCFLTGYDRSIIPSDFRHTPVLSKPCDAAQLKLALDTLLFRRPSPAAELPPPARGNRLLDGLAVADRVAIDPWLKPVRLSAGQVLEPDGTPGAQVIFPETAVVSLEVDSNGRRIQAAMVGREGVIGAAALVGARVGNRAVVQIEGKAWRASVDDIARLAANPGLHNRLEEAFNGLVIQLSRTLLATGHATIEQRVARFLLMASDRTDATDVPITHGVLADTLGVRRAGVTVSLHVLEGKKAVRSERKRVRILDRAALTAAAGGFYRGE